MRLFPQGSIPWLLGFELKLQFRAWLKTRKIVLIIFVPIYLAAMLFGGITLAEALENTPFSPTPLLTLWLDGAALALFTLFVSQTLSLTVQSFYERGDLDLLLSSPLPPARTLFVRCLSIATGPVMFAVMLMTPFVVPMAIFGHAPVLASYGVVVALSLLAASTGLVVATALFALIGPRRTKTVGQILAAVVGASIFLLSQSANMLPDRGRAFFGWLAAQSHHGIFAAASPLSWPARAVLGEPRPLVAILAIAFAVYAVTVRMAGRRFAGDAAAAAGVAVPASTARRSVSGPFRGGVIRALIRKELHLIWRDPALISQVLLRVLFLVPLGFVLLRNARFGSEMAVAGSAGAVVFIASQIMGSLAWIAISAEDSPDLLRSAPIAPEALRRAKLAAAFLPVFWLCVGPALVLLVLRPLAGVATALGVIGAAAATGLVNLWYEKPTPRKNFRRRGQGSLIATFGELFLGYAAATAAAMVASGSLIGLAASLIPLALVGGLLGLLYLGRNKEM